MDISSASSVNSLSGQATGESVSNIMQKKVMDMATQNAAALIDALPQPSKPSSVNLPSHLGQNINTKA
ncbi:MAG: YjfB family protein [Betaproteobacteria bacterium]|nr:YjfB family protein [Betaproteobacteria bacterium]